jgi:N-acetylglutamate synthase-like GNAT family acetyltransferase
MTPSFTLRPATSEDARAIQTLVWAAGINPTGLKWPRFVVATSSDGVADSPKVIACGQVKPHADGSRELASIVVAPSWQGQGVARAIIEHLLDTYPGELHLMCRSPLGPFYEKFGFRVIEDDEMPTYFRRIKGLTKVAEFVMADGDRLFVMRKRG